MAVELSGKKILHWIELLHLKHTDTYVCVQVPPLDLADIVVAMNAKGFECGIIAEIDAFDVTYIHVPLLNFLAVEDEGAIPIAVQITVLEREARQGAYNAWVKRDATV